jgi:hypothetical protein
MIAVQVEMLAAERDLQDDATRLSIYETRLIDGENDAAYGRLPEYADAGYLEGYVAQLKKLRRDSEGRLIHYSPRQHFAFGYMDGVGDRSDGESNYEYNF